LLHSLGNRLSVINNFSSFLLYQQLSYNPEVATSSHENKRQLPSIFLKVKTQRQEVTAIPKLAKQRSFLT